MPLQLDPQQDACRGGHRVRHRPVDADPVGEVVDRLPQSGPHPQRPAQLVTGGQAVPQGGRPGQRGRQVIGLQAVHPSAGQLPAALLRALPSPGGHAVPAAQLPVLPGQRLLQERSRPVGQPALGPRPGRDERLQRGGGGLLGGRVQPGHGLVEAVRGRVPAQDRKAVLGVLHGRHGLLERGGAEQLARLGQGVDAVRRYPGLAAERTRGVQQGHRPVRRDAGRRSGHHPQPAERRLLRGEAPGDLLERPPVVADPRRMPVRLLFADRPQLTECVRLRGPRGVQLLLVPGDPAPVVVRVVGALAFQDRLDGSAQLLLGDQAVVRPADAQLADARRELVLEHLERPGGVTGDQHPLPVREQVRDQVGDGVRLPGAGRALHHDEPAAAQAVRDGPLLLVGGQREVGLGRPAARGLVPAVGRRPAGLGFVAGDEAEQLRRCAALLDGPGDTVQRLDVGPAAALPEQHRGGEADARIGRRGRPVRSLLPQVPPGLVGGDRPDVECLVQLLQLAGLGAAAGVLQEAEDVLAGLAAALLPRVEHALLQGEPGSVGVGPEGEHPGVRVEFEHRPGGQQVPPDRLVPGRPGQQA